MLQHIIPSKVRRKILELFYHNPEGNYYLRDIVRKVNEEVNAVKRELDILHEGKVLLREKRLNKVFYSLNRSYIFYDEFLRIFTKTSSLATQITKNISRLGKVKYVAVSTKFSRKVDIREDEIYLLFVGVIVIPEAETIVNKAKTDFGREINFTVMTEDELNFRKKNNDPFMWRFLKQPKVMVVGNEEELLK